MRKDMKKDSRLSISILKRLQATVIIKNVWGMETRATVYQGIENNM
jgi:hypothetical protein